MADDPTSELLAAIRERIKDPSHATEAADLVTPKIYPPATSKIVDDVELALDLSLPVLLRRLYTEVGNGGFGPGYGLLGVTGGATAQGKTMVDIYRAFRTSDAEDPAWQWPKGLLPICSLGCGMYACIDCSTPEGSVIWFEPNPREQGEPLQRFLIPVAPALAGWLAAWLRDQDWLSAAFEKSELKR